jgi:hypothetical protein
MCEKATKNELSFNLDELADAINFLMKKKLIYKLGISHEKYVHYKVGLKI